LPFLPLLLPFRLFVKRVESDCHDNKAMDAAIGEVAWD
jgi:hypothetical protein